jgi:hypothetical protein
MHLHRQSFQLKTHATAILVKLAVASLGNLTQRALFLAGTCCQRKPRQVLPLSKIALTLKDPLTWATFSAQFACNSNTSQTCLGFLRKCDTNREFSIREMFPKEAKVSAPTVAIESVFATALCKCKCNLMVFPFLSCLAVKDKITKIFIQLEGK